MPGRGVGEPELPHGIPSPPYHPVMRFDQVPISSPAQRFIDEAAWLIGGRSVVVGLTALDHTSVEVTVEDPFVNDPADRRFADRLAADSALSVLEQAARGVRLIPTTRDGYVGELRELAPAQLTFLNGLPGVQRIDLVPDDIDGDGHVAPEEAAYRVEVGTTADVARIDWLLRDRLDDGAVQDGPVQISVPAPLVSRAVAP